MSRYDNELVDLTLIIWSKMPSLWLKNSDHTVVMVTEKARSEVI